MILKTIKEEITVHTHSTFDQRVKVHHHKSTDHPYVSIFPTQHPSQAIVVVDKWRTIPFYR